jgi:hypothetical protein
MSFAGLRGFTGFGLNLPQASINTAPTATGQKGIAICISGTLRSKYYATTSPSSLFTNRPSDLPPHSQEID